MSPQDTHHAHGEGDVVTHDPVESIIHAVPIVLPVAGGVLMFLLAFIAIYMA